MTTSIRFLGSGNAFADGGRSHACIHVTAPGVSLLLDCGGSSLPAIKRAVDPATIDGVAVSHLHGDHFGGITFLVLEQHFAGRTRPFTVAGPAALEERVRAANDALFPDFFRTRALGFEVRYAVLDATEREVAGAMVAALPVRHVKDADPHGLRVRAAGTLVAYSGDVRWSEHLPPVADGADLFICECSHFTREDPAHISYRTLMEHRADLRCRRIVLTHLGAEALAHRAEIALECADDGTRLEV